MKLTLCLLVFLLSNLFSSTIVHAENGISLEEALTQGAENNPQLKSSHAALMEALWKKKENFGSFLPKVDLIGSHFTDLKYQQIQLSPTSVFDSTYPKTTFEAQAVLNLFDGLKSIYSYQSSSANYEAADYEYTQVKLITENAIRLKFFQAIGAQVLASVAEKNVKTLTDHLKKAQDLLNHGELTKVDVLKIQVQLEQAIPEKLSAIDNAFLARRSLTEAMGLDQDERQLLSTLPIPKEEMVVNVDPKASLERLDLKALQKRTEASEELYKASRSIWMPKINLIADYQYYNNRNFSLSESDKFRNAYSLGVSFSWNLFDGGSSYARQESSYYQKIQLEQKSKKMALATSNEVEFWKRRYQNSAILYAAKLRSVEASKESVRIYQNGLKAGTRTNSDLLDAELDLDRSEAGVIKAQVDAVEAQLNLELAMGRRL